MGLCLVAVGGARAQPQPPVDYEYISYGGLPGHGYLGDAELVDINADGRMDVVMTGLGSPLSPVGDAVTPRTGLYLAVQDLSEFATLPYKFERQTDFNVPGLLYSTVAPVDYDNDGDVDLLFMGAQAGSLLYSPLTLLYEHDGDLGFSRVSTFPGLHNGSADWGDYDNDGDPDLLLTGVTEENNFVTLLYRNEGDGDFEPVALPDEAGVGYGMARWGDYDGDNDLDFAVTGAHTDARFTSRIYRNDAGVFTPLDAGLPGLSHSRLAWFDADGDGRLDLLLTGGFLNPFILQGKTALFRNLGDDRFEEVPAAFENADLFGGELATLDLNNDGVLEVVLSGRSTATEPQRARVYENTGGVFRSSYSFSGMQSLILASADHDSDGDLDVLFSGIRTTGGSLAGRTFLLDNLEDNTLPSAPFGLRTEVDATTGEIVFSWNPGSDEETPAQRLSYNLRVGTLPGRSDILAPLADLATGRRWVGSPGNVGTNTSWRLQVPIGAYYWSVQAIDGSYAGSAFASEQPIFFGDPNDKTPPAPPENLQVVSDVRQVHLTWQLSPDADVARQYIYRDTQPAPTTLLTNVLPDAQTYTDSAVEDGVTYYYRISAEDASGNESAFTDTQTATPMPPFEQVDGTGLDDVAEGTGVWGDYDGDGDLDLLLTGSGRTVLYRNAPGPNGAPLFVQQQTFDRLSVSAVAWGDYDGDGDLDFAIAGFNTRRETLTKLYRNDAGTFFDTVAGLPGFLQADLAWGDYDNDGDLDLLITGSENIDVNTWTSSTLLFRNDLASLGQARTFTEVEQAGLHATADGAAAWGDYDGDQDLDLFLAGSGITNLYRNDWRLGGGFASANESFAQLANASAEWGDYDADGDLDFLATGTSFPPLSVPMVVTRIYRRDGGQFTDLQLDLDLRSDLVGISEGEAAWGDYDNDGDFDFIVAGTAQGRPTTRVYHNAAGRFDDLDAGLQDLFAGTVAWGDYDGDGDLDVLLTGLVPGDRTNEPATLLYRNNVITPNTPPTTPTGLAQQIEGTEVTFSWQAATDAETPAPGLTYNLRVGTTAGASDVVAPMSLPDGTRLVPALGNAFHNTAWTLDLPPGTYYWSVQAVDHAFAGSPFAREQSLKVTTNNAQSVDTEQPSALRLALAPPFPNPFGAQTEIGYVIEAPGPVRLAIYDVLGRMVKVLAEGYTQAGVQVVTWDGRSGDGARLGSGLYMLRLEAGGKHLVRTMTLLR